MGGNLLSTGGKQPAGGDAVAGEGERIDPKTGAAAARALKLHPSSFASSWRPSWVETASLSLGQLPPSVPTEGPMLLAANTELITLLGKFIGAN